MKNIFSIAIKIALIILLVLCLFKMPFGYYQLVRFAALVGFALLAVDAFQNKRLVEGTLFVCLALLFQPFIKVTLEREIWHWVDIAVSAGLLISIPIGLVKHDFKKEIEMQPKKETQKIIAREFLILLGISIVVCLIYLVSLGGQKIVQAKIEKLSLHKDSLKLQVAEIDARKIPTPINDKLRILYEGVSEDYELGTLQEFISKMADSVKRRVFYNEVSKKYDLGDYETFESKIFFIPPAKNIFKSAKTELPTYEEVMGNNPTKKGTEVADYFLPIKKPQKHGTISLLTLLDISKKKKQISDSIARPIKMKLEVIEGSINSNFEMYRNLENLWLWALAILCILAYPIRLFVLATVWSIKTVKSQ